MDIKIFRKWQIKKKTYFCPNLGFLGFFKNLKNLISKKPKNPPLHFTMLALW
jgi:hypothetical protein